MLKLLSTSYKVNDFHSSYARAHPVRFDPDDQNRSLLALLAKVKTILAPLRDKTTY